MSVMLRRVGQSIQPHLRRAYHQTRSISQARRRSTAITFFASGVTIGSYLWYSGPQKIHNDSETVPGTPQSTPVAPQDKLWLSEANLWRDQDTLHTLVWGSNDYQVLDILTPSATVSEGKERDIRCPIIAKWLENVALRDMQLHRRHAACVDARGDIYQWGDGFLEASTWKGTAKPIATLKGKNIIKIQLTENKLYALSASGKVFVLATGASEQKVTSSSPGSSVSFTSWLWADSKTTQCQNLTPQASLGWNEKFISIVAGDNHLLVLTNKGRTFAHPVNKEANRYGQLGIQSFEIPDPAPIVSKTKPASLKIELPQKSTQNSSGRIARIIPSADAATDLSKIDDSTIHWCTHLYEIPSLRGVEVSQIAAGGKSSFVRTPTGRVLGWGANEYGQIGLGANVTLDMITLPTEVILWRMTSKHTHSNCLNVTARGDLTSFVVERSTAGNPTTTDLLMCGNGQNGGLGNNTYTNAQGNPVRVKNMSGLLQYSDRTKRLELIKPTDIVISPTGHVLAALDSAAESDGVGGQDLMAWGKNFNHELGNGKKSSTTTPCTLEAPDGGRLMLMKRKAKKVADLGGQVWKRKVSVEQRFVVGYGNTAVYWKIA